MNVPAKTVEHDPETGEITGLPAGYENANQSLAVSLARAEVDQQIATARALPRSPARVMQAILSLATLDEKSAEECIYALPRGGKAIRGPSIRLAEIIGSQWGNCRIGARVVHVDRAEKYVEAEGVFHDLETNTATTARVRRRLTAEKKTGQITEDMIVLTGNAACSIAKRNAILGGVPKAVWRKAYEAVESVIAGDSSTLVERRDKAMKAFAAFGVTPERVSQALGVKAIEEITLEHMPILMGAHAALKNGEATVEELFPLPGKEGESEKPIKGLGDRLDALANAGSQKTSNKETKKSDAGSPSGSGEAGGRPNSSRGSAAEKPSPDTPSASGDGTPIERARAAGRQARSDGLSRKAIPAEYRGNDELRDAYLDAFDSGDETEVE